VTSETKLITGPSNIPLKLKEKIWNGEFVELNLMLKSNQTLLNELSTVGNLAVKEGILSVVHEKSSPIRNLFVVDWEQLVNVGADRLVNVGADRLVNVGADRLVNFGAE
jgi:hypothetical protein